MIKIEYKRTDNAVIDEALSDKLYVLVDGHDITAYNEKRSIDRPDFYLYAFFDTILKIFSSNQFWENNEVWNEFTLGFSDSGYDIIIRNLNKNDIKIACKEVTGRSFYLQENGEFFRVNKQEFYDECLRVIGIFIGESAWGSNDKLRILDKTSLFREFMNKYNALAEIKQL